MKIIKRDNSIVNYSLEKISIAISGAFLDIGQEFTDLAILEEVEDLIQQTGKTELHVEEVQDLVEEALMNCGYVDAARAYIRYRYDHELARNQKREALLVSKLRATNVENQNANVDEHSFGGRMGEANGVILREYALNNCMSKKSRDNHLNMEIYIHDLDHYAVGDHNCLSIPFDDLLAKGFNTRQTDVRPANSVNTAFQLVAVIFQLQSLQQFGGVAATHIDWTMVPYVRKSFYKHFKDGVLWCEDQTIMANGGYIHWVRDLEGKQYNDSLSIEDELYDAYPQAKKYAMAMTNKEVYQAVEGMYHNLNTLQSRSGNQLKRVAA